MQTYALIRDQLFQIAADGFIDEQIGETYSFGWFAIVTAENDKRYIISEDHQGFRDWQHYADEDWHEITDMYASYYDTKKGVA